MQDLDNFSPVVAEATITGTSTWAEFQVPSCEYIRLYPVSGTNLIYLNSKNNLKSFTLNEPMTIPNVDGQISIVNVYFSGAATINIKAIQSPRGVIIK